jgi:hypothetical protein
MSNKTITFRRANESDLREIWYLLHAESRMLPEEQILKILNDLYVLSYQTRILGVLYGTYVGSKVNIKWVVIHPLYPEIPLRDAMIQEFSGVLCREPRKKATKTLITNYCNG